MCHDAVDSRATCELLQPPPTPPPPLLLELPADLRLLQCTACICARMRNISREAQQKNVIKTKLKVYGKETRPYTHTLLFSHFISILQSFVYPPIQTMNDNSEGISDRTPDGGYIIKTYHPTYEQMKDFSAFMRYVHQDGGHRAGLAKIIPPPGYKPRKAGYEDEALYEMKITSPIRQEVSGEGGLYQQLNVIDKKKMTVRNFKRLSEEKHATPEYQEHRDLERQYWRNIYTNPSIYGADVPGSLYDDDEEHFNLTKLNTILDNIQKDYKITIQGVNTTYLYFGMWKSSFCWHTEDMDLYSINYLHTGAPKSWYCIAPEYGKRFERLASSFFPHSFRTCKAFLRHKTTMISPAILKKYSIPFSKITQQAGEFMVTFPFSYHSGYNHGFNIAEATNFALEYWIDFGKWATRCECSAESVKISMQTFVKQYQADRYENWLRGKDVCSDPRDPKHVAAAPKPTQNDLYLFGTHERQFEAEMEEEESRKRVALQQNQSSNLKSRTAKVAKKNRSAWAETYQRYNEFLLAHNNNEQEQPPTLEHYAPIPSDMKPTTEPISLLDPQDVSLNIQIKKVYGQIVPKQAKDKAKEKSKLKKEKRTKERIISSRMLLQYLPVSFTHEKRFNRCITAYPPHCAVCQLLAPHPKDDEKIWGPKEPEDLTTAGPQVETFTLPPEQKEVLLPRFMFISSDIIKKPDIEINLDDHQAGAPSMNSPLIQCSICMLTVHKLCYGLGNNNNDDDNNQESNSDWVCLRCKEPNRSTLSCTLCPCRGGAIVPVGSLWAHITCAICVPDIKIPDLSKKDIDLLDVDKNKDKIQDKTLDKRICIYCAKNNLPKYVQGRMITCVGHWGEHGVQVTCENAFHVTCGHRNGAKFDYIDHHIDPDLVNPIQAACDECEKKSRRVNATDVDLYDEANHNDKFESEEPLDEGARVVGLSSCGKYLDGTIVRKAETTLYEVFFPQRSEVETLIHEKRIVNLDPNQDFKLGDKIIVRQARGESLEGKFKSRRETVEYHVKFDRIDRVEKIERRFLCLSVDQLTEEQLRMYPTNDNFIETELDQEIEDQPINLKIEPKMEVE